MAARMLIVNNDGVNSDYYEGRRIARNKIKKKREKKGDDEVSLSETDVGALT